MDKEYQIVATLNTDGDFGTERYTVIGEEHTLVCKVNGFTEA